MRQIRHRIANSHPPFPLPIDGVWLVGPRLRIFKNQIFEPEVMEFLRKRIGKETVFGDVGAQYGFHTINMARELIRYGQKVYAFEPSNRNRRKLWRNCKLNNLESNVVIFPQLVSDVTGYSRYSETNETAVSEFTSEKDILVKTTSLDDTGIDFSLVKIDVEGLDLQVLKGAKKLIESGCQFTIEIGERFLKNKLENYIEDIRSLGVDLRALPEAKDSLSNRKIIKDVRSHLHINVAAIPI
jgi:FkbM family methyltransferase